MKWVRTVFIAVSRGTEMKQDRISELIIKACDDMEERRLFQKTAIQVFIIIGILASVAGYFGFLGDL